MKSASTLKELVICYERRTEWCKNAIAKGLSTADAETLSSYLLSEKTIDEAIAAIRHTGEQRGVTITSLNLGAPGEIATWMTRGNWPGALFWSLTDGVNYYRGSFASVIAGLSETEYFGSSPAVHGVCSNKMVIAAISRSLGIPTLPILQVNLDGPLPIVLDFGGVSTYFVKPKNLGAQIGITSASKQTSLSEAWLYGQELIRQYRQGAIIQPYISGTDLRAMYFGNGIPESPNDRIAIYKVEKFSCDGQFVDIPEENGVNVSEYILTDIKDLKEYDPDLCRCINQYVYSIAKYLRLKDIFAIDFRIDREGIPWFFEINSLPFINRVSFEQYLRRFETGEFYDDIFTIFERGFGLPKMGPTLFVE